jgi:3-hydroxybutyryl-CoA dehydrogenase
MGVGIMKPDAVVGVIGSGTMGHGIAHVAARSGFRVVLVDLEESLLRKAMETVASELQRAVDKGKMQAAERDAALGRIRTSTSITSLNEAAIAIEAIVELLEAKRDLFARLDGVCRPEAILATNTSSISITRIAAATKRPGSVIGMHFMNPVPVMELVEVIRGQLTGDATVAETTALALALGKKPVEASDYPGFVSNRVLMPMINEAITALMEGVATRDAIDAIMKLGMRHPMGPLELADFIGLDVCLHIMEVLHEGFLDPRYRPCPLLRRMVDAGLLGRKSGRGFYEYPPAPGR